MYFHHNQQPFYPGAYGEMEDLEGFNLLDPLGLFGGGGGGGLLGGLTGGGGGPLGMVGGLLKGLPLIGGMFGGGEGDRGPKPADPRSGSTAYLDGQPIGTGNAVSVRAEGGGSGIPGLPFLPDPLGIMGQALGQGAGQGAARNPLAAILGAGLGGVQTGTGPLPGPLGRVSDVLFGTQGLPPNTVVVGAGLQNHPEVRELQSHTEKAGRAVVNRVLGIAGPDLDRIRRMLEQGQNQFDATAEHRNLTREDRFRRQVLGHLLEIRGKLASRGRLVPLHPSSRRPDVIPGFVF